jgi:hypothetical protein
MNVLEAAVLLTTSAEVRSGQFFNFCNQFRSMKYCGLKFIIVINNSDFDPAAILFLNEIKIFQSIQVYDIDIPARDDIYVRGGQRYHTTEWPRLGLSSGPNILFFQTIKLCAHLNTILILETDCILKHNCFDACINYVSGMCDFLISGSKYLGNATMWNTHDNIFHHLNGVAFYRTGNSELQNLIKDVESYMCYKVSERTSLSYDVCIMSYVHHRINNDIDLKNYYRSVEAKLTVNTFILNYSLDSSIKREEIDKIFPNHVILHSKLNI